MTIGEQAPLALARTPHRADVFRVPRPVAGEPGLFLVDSTWGTVSPMRIAPGVETVGELEVIAQIEAGGAIIDVRRPESFADGSIPGARGIPHTEIEEHLDSFAPGTRTVLFCNGPACAASPQAIRKLLDAGVPPQALLYYRGGLLDWLTLGFPLAS